MKREVFESLIKVKENNDIATAKGVYLLLMG